MKRLNLLVLLFIGTLFFSCKSTHINTLDKTIKGYEIKFNNIYINDISTTDLKKIETEKSEDKNVLFIFTKKAKQKDFNLLCSEFDWIEKIEIQTTEEMAINNLNAISSLKNLKYLKINVSGFKQETPIDLFPLKSISQLEKVDFYGTKVINEDVLGLHTALRDINFGMSAISSLDFLIKTPHVENLSLYGYKHSFTNYVPVTHLKKLKVLSIYMNKQAVDEKLNVLKKLTSLTTIRMANCKEITSLDFLENCHSLEYIHATWCTNLTDFSALVNFPKLEYLDIWDTPIEDLNVLSKNINLNYINLDGTKITDISPLKSLKDLSSINIYDTSIKDISPLYGHPSLFSLKVSSIVPQEQIKKMEEIGHVSIDVQEK